MKLDNPNTWLCPENSHPDYDKLWEIAELRYLAITLSQLESDLWVEINTNDPTCLFFSIFKDTLKLGEAYVNRKSENSEVPLFSIFYGTEETEFNSSSHKDCAKKLAESNEFFDEI